MDNYISSTLFFSTSLYEERNTIKRTSASIPMGQTTDNNTMLSLFELPKEKIEIMEADVNFDIAELQ